MSQTSNQLSSRSAQQPTSPSDVIVDAVYQDGVFKPLKPLDLPPGTTIQMRIAAPPQAAGKELESPQPAPKAVREVDPAIDLAAAPAPAGKAFKPTTSGFPLPVLALGLVFVTILGFIVYRSVRGSTPAGGGDATAGGNSQERKLSGPPLITPAQAAGPALAAPEVELEFKLPAMADGSPIEPRDLAVDSQGNIYIASNNDGTIRKYGPTGNLLTSWGNASAPQGGEPIFKELFGLVIDRNDTVYALDSAAGSILRFDAKGAPKGEPITGLGYYPRGIALAPSGEILVADTGGGRVIRVNPEQGAIVGEYGRAPEGSGDSSEPVDAVMKSNGESYVVDARNDRVQRFDADGTIRSQWAINLKIAARDSGHLALDRGGRLYLTSPAMNEIVVFNDDGSILGTWQQSESDKPVGIFADGQDNLYVTFPELGAVRKYKVPPAQETEPPQQQASQTKKR